MNHRIDPALAPDLRREGLQAIKAGLDLGGHGAAGRAPVPGARVPQGHVKDGASLRGVDEVARKKGCTGLGQPRGLGKFNGAGEAFGGPGLL